MAWDDEAGELGLSPQYVNRALTDLASDQMDMEDAVKALSRNVMIVGAMAAGSVGLGVFCLRLFKRIIDNTQVLGEALRTTQIYVGMAGKPPVAPEETPTPAPAASSDGYDPGPQPGPVGPLPEVPADPEVQH